MGHLFGEIELLAEQFHALVAMYDKGQIKPHVDRTFRFSEAAAAHHYLHDRKAKGKVLLVPDAWCARLGMASLAGEFLEVLAGPVKSIEARRADNAVSSRAAVVVGSNIQIGDHAAIGECLCLFLDSHVSKQAMA